MRQQGVVGGQIFFRLAARASVDAAADADVADERRGHRTDVLHGHGMGALWPRTAYMVPASRLAGAAASATPADPPRRVIEKR